MVKKLIFILLVAALPAGYASAAVSEQASDSDKTIEAVQDVKKEKTEFCTVVKIEGTKVDLKNDKEEKFAMNISDPDTLEGLKVGDRVMVKNGKVSKEK